MIRKLWLVIIVFFDFAKPTYNAARVVYTSYFSFHFTLDASPTPVSSPGCTGVADAETLLLFFAAFFPIDMKTCVCYDTGALALLFLRRVGAWGRLYLSEAKTDFWVNWKCNPMNKTNPCLRYTCTKKSYPGTALLHKNDNTACTVRRFGVKSTR